MKLIEVKRGEIPHDWTEEHVRLLEHGHERGTMSNAANGRTKVVDKVLRFASDREIGLSVMGGLTFVDLHGQHGNGPVQFKVVE